MRAYHNSRELKFRDPFGAVQAGGAVSISIDTWDGEPDWVELKLRVDKKGDRYITMDRQGGRFTCTVTLDTADIYWYSFICHWNDGGTCWYGPQRGRVGGVGDIYGWDCPEYQITVYKPRPVPDWYKHAIVYQIFPDRFRRGPGWRENAARVLSKPRRGTPKALVEDWNAPVEYKRRPDGSIGVWEFYGGTLSGITEKLDYLQGLGVTALYLNPIFEAVSNHRYDTGDYRRVDGMLGEEHNFVELAQEAKKRGISLILDGVFNHTGCDSKYFNKFGNYPDPGACQGEGSPYDKWFRFYRFPDKYECWWGVEDLPDVEEHDPSYRDYIFAGPDSVVRHWLRLGASGWRLDVADELPDDFIAGIKEAVTDELGQEGLLIGEVWEDASNKVSYGELRRYFLGDELDGVMNYPFRSGVLHFLTGSKSAEELAETMLSLRENYPPEALRAELNMMGSHDRMRIISMLGNAPDPNSLSEQQRRDYKLSEGQRGMAKGRFWLMALMQMTLPGVPCIYYGDEAGMEGYADPYNRGTYPWGHEDRDFATMYRNTVNLRRTFPELAEADFMPFSAGPEVFGFYRDWADEGIAVAVNRGWEQRTVTLDVHGEDVTDTLGGARFEVRDGKITLELWPLGSAILHFHKKTRLGLPLKRGSGILAHITSLPSEAGPGTIGRPAYDFVDFLAASGQKYWQILPINPTDPHGSPYAGASAFAANLSLLPESEAELRELFKSFTPDGDYQKFLETNRQWLEPYALFTALKAKLGQVHFTQWPEAYRRYDPKMLSDPELAAEAEFQKFCQYRFEVQWHALRAYAKGKGVTIIGDMPMYVSSDSADVWAEPEQFMLGPDGLPGEIAGVPPTWKDAGQLWGNPLYDWTYMEKTDFDWWMRRFRRMLDLYDFTRLDHFMGFESYWATPAGKTPKEGRWRFGPGLALFRRAYELFGPLPLVAEDLGDITPAIRALLSRCGFLGTDVAQFKADPLADCTPAREKIAYSGTHDNQTLVGYCDRYADRKPAEAAKKIMEDLLASDADVVILQLQDVLGLDDTARMNTPGTTDKNWKWQADKKHFEGVSKRLLSDTIKTNRS